MNKDTNQIMALLNAYKMDGLGNDFVIIDRRKKSIDLREFCWENQATLDTAVDEYWFQLSQIEVLCIKVHHDPLFSHIDQETGLSEP